MRITMGDLVMRKKTAPFPRHGAPEGPVKVLALSDQYGARNGESAILLEGDTWRWMDQYELAGGPW